MCNASYCDVTHPTLPGVGKYVTLTSNKGGLRFKKDGGDIGKLQSAIENCDTVKLDLERRRLILNVNRTKYQEILGFGAAFTDSAGYNAGSLTSDVRDTLLKSLYTKGGLSYNMGRVPIGGTDFSLRGYTYDDTNYGDKELKHFSLQKEDHVYKIPFIKAACDLASDDLLLTSTVWSPPLFMKSNHSFMGRNHLKKEYYASYANYFVRFLEEYNKNGIKFWSITPGNEFTGGQYANVFVANNLGWMADKMANFIGDFFGPAIRNSQFNNTKILILDDNRHVFMLFYQDLMSYGKVQPYMDGMAVHAYFDTYVNASPLDKYAVTYPDKIIATTEYCVGVAETEPTKKGAWKRAESYAKVISNNLNHFSSSFFDWNFALNMTGGPTYTGNTVDAAILVDAEANRFYKQPSYYAIGHFSKYFQRGSHRIGVVETTRSELEYVAVERPDGHVALVVSNLYDYVVKTTVLDPKVGQIDLELTPNSITTLIY